MIINLNLVEDNLDELLKRMKMLKKASVEVGMFNTEKHKDEYHNQSDFTNVSLFRYLSDGDPENNMAPRPVLDIAFQFNPLKSSTLTKDLKQYFKGIAKNKTQADLDKVMHNLGKYYRGKVVSYMGDPTILAENLDNTVEWKEKRGFTGQAPMVMTGQLRDHVGYYYEDKSYEYKY